jgi:hypothetical protein
MNNKMKALMSLAYKFSSAYQIIYNREFDTFCIRMFINNYDFISVGVDNTLPEDLYRVRAGSIIASSHAPSPRVTLLDSWFGKKRASNLKYILVDLDVLTRVLTNHSSALQFKSKVEPKPELSYPFLPRGTTW